MIDIAIGLALIYTMFAALVSGLGEILAMRLQWRGKMLVRGIESILSGVTAAGPNTPTLNDAIYQHPLVAMLRDGARLPSYIPASTFSLAFADTLVRGCQVARPLFEGLPEAIVRMPDSPLKHGLNLLVVEAAGNPDKLRTLLEAHYDTVMDRVSGWYKRKSQIAMFVIALVTAVALNLDSVAITQQLSDDRELRDRLVAQAEQVVRQPAPVAPTAAAAASADPAAAIAAVGNLQAQLEQLKAVQLPIGWRTDTAGNLIDVNGDPFDPRSVMLLAAGWLISALAATMGAPFWFDALSRLVSLRGAGGKPASSTATHAAAAGAAPAATVVITSPPTAAGQAAASEPASDFERVQLTELDIENIQRALGIPQTMASGLLDDATRSAIRLWQRMNGRTETGVLDEPAVLQILHPGD